MTFRWIAAAFGLSLMLAAPPAHARACGARAHVVAKLATTYGETAQSMGLGANNGIVELYASDETRTWTITVTLPNGQTCLIATGTAFEPLAPAERPDGEGI